MVVIARDNIPALTIAKS